MPSDEHPQSHPEHLLFLYQLTPARFKRDGLSDKKEDLDKTINRLIEDISLPLVHPTRDEIQTLLELTFALLHRLKLGFWEPDEVNSTIKYLRELHDCPLDDFDVPHDAVTAPLVEMLASRAMREAGDPVEDINEILFFCRGLTLGTSPDYLTSASRAFTQAMLDACSRGNQIQSLNDAVVCLREVLKSCSPDLHQVSFDLANLLAVRFLVYHVENDYEEAKVLLDRITAPRPKSPCHCQASALATVLGYARSIAISNPKDSQGEVSHCQSFLEHCSLFGDPLHPVITALLVSHLEQGSNHIISPQGAQAAHSEIARPLLPTRLPVVLFEDGADGSEIVPAPLPTSLGEKITRLRDHYSAASTGTDKKRNYLSALVRCYNDNISRTLDTTFIEEAIKYNKRFLATTHPTDNSYSFHLSSFANSLYSAFNHTMRVKYLGDSIALLDEVFRLDGTQQIRFVTTRRLIQCLHIRWELDGRQQESPDLHKVMDLFASGVKDTHAVVPSRFDLACDWVKTARTSKHHSLSAAYENIMSLMQSSLVFVPTLFFQHNRLVEKRDIYEKIPFNFASHLINAGKPEQAVEALEHGRALLWSEMRGFRTETNQLRAADPVLADRFTAINQELEIVTTDDLPDTSREMDDEGPEDDEWTGKYTDLMNRRHKLSTELDDLITQIRGLPGLENFLLPLPFDTLRSAASHGPVVIINHCELGSGVIIVLHNSPPSCIPMPPDFFDRANQLKVRLLEARKDYCLNPEDAPLDVPEEYEDTLSDVLKELYDLVGISVVNGLNELGIAEQSRVWWCPTSAFWFLPLHAMGPIPSDDGVVRYFSDLYISSYTPTLSALITSRRPHTQTSSRLTLLVAQPQPAQSPPGAWKDTLVIRGLDLQTTVLSSRNMTPTAVLDNLRRHKSTYIPCDVTREAKPFEAAMLFHNEERLDLLDIVRSKHSTGDFAFLPGSHTAEVTVGCIPDEVLQFSAAIQFSGYRSVVGTIGRTDDKDRRNLAESVYRSMFSKKEGVEPYYEGSARALQSAVQLMRSTTPSPPLVRWVNFAHYGA